MTHEKKQQQPQMNVIQRLNAAFADELINRPFPVERLSMEWRENAKYALMFASPHSLGVSADIFLALVEKMPIDNGYSLSFFEFATLSNNLESRSARDLDIDSLLDYANLMIEANTHVHFYSDETDKIRKEIEKKIAEEDQMKKTAAGDRGGLSPVKAEA